MKDTTKVKAVPVLVFASVPHKTIVRPRFQEWKDMYIIRVIDETGKCLQSFEHKGLEKAEIHYYKMLEIAKRYLEKANKSL